MIRVLITGANGQLAKELQHTAPVQYNVKAVSREQVDITDSASVSRLISDFQPNVVINAAAYTKVDQAESEYDLAHSVNAEAPGLLAHECRIAGCALIHISTDFVFDGHSSKPYTVGCKTGPANQYGKSKLAGENNILSSGLENFAIIRTSWVYSQFGNNFVKTMLRLMEERDAISVVGDQIGSPTSACRMANMLWNMIEKSESGSGVNLDFSQKTFHWSDSGVASWYDFAVAIQREGLKHNILAKKITVRCIPSEQFPTPASRPNYSVMDTSELHALLSEPTSHWSNELEQVVEAIAKGAHTNRGSSQP